MKPPDQVPLLHRAILAFLIIVLVLFILALIGWLSGGWEQAGAAQTQQSNPTWVPSKWDDHIDALERQALDEAFKKHIMALYSVWVTDNYEPRIPPKALTGARNARDAYIRSMESIEKREQLPRWQEKKP
jgi:hypothetical protein